MNNTFCNNVKYRYSHTNKLLLLLLLSYAEEGPRCQGAHYDMGNNSA